MLPIDGSWPDILTILVGVLCLFVRPVKRWQNKAEYCFDRKSCAADFLNGATIVPFAMLIGSTVSSKLMEEVMREGKASVAVAGVVGLIFVLAELFTTK